MTHKQTVAVFLIIGVLVSPLSGVSHAQDDVITGLTLERFGILTTLGSGARPLGMGGAYTAVSDDAFALFYNPAGLSQVSRGEFAIGIHHGIDEIDNDYLGEDATTRRGNTKLGHLSIVFPSSTYIGDFAFGFGVFKAGSSELEYARYGYISDYSSNVENIYMQSGGIWQYHFGMGMEVSRRVSIGGSFVIWNENLSVYEEIVDEEPDSTAFFTDDVKLNLDGFSFNFGVHMLPTRYLRLGVLIATPVWLRYQGDGISAYWGSYPTGPYEGWDCGDEYGVIEEEYTLPWRFRGGFAYELPYLMLSADAEYVDYSQTKWYGKRLVNDLTTRRGDVFNSVWNLYAGAELFMPDMPVSLRVGYMYLPLAPAVMEEIVYLEEDDPCDYYLPTDIAGYDVLKERQIVTFGASFIIDDTFALEAAAAFGGFERDTGRLYEKHQIRDFIISGSFRF
jgi:hypothetical protein